jgi:hypothetical protein
MKGFARIIIILHVDMSDASFQPLSSCSCPVYAATFFLFLSYSLYSSLSIAPLHSKYGIETEFIFPSKRKIILSF